MSIFASAFTPISVSSAKENIASAEKFILFIGRPSCPYCQLFEPKLSNVARKFEFNIFYINSENTDELGFRLYVNAMVLRLYLHCLSQKKELRRLFVTLRSLRKTFQILSLKLFIQRFLCLFVNTRVSIMKQIEWELLIIQIMFNGWKRPELFSKEFRMAL